MEELPRFSKKSASLEFITKKLYSQKRIYKTAPRMEKPESQRKECNRWSFAISMGGYIQCVLHFPPQAQN